MADDDRSSRIVLIDRQAATSTVLMAQSAGLHVLAWEPDGRFEPMYPGPTWSRDGRFLLFRAQDHNARIGLYRVSAESGEAELLVAQPHGYEFRRTADWTADGTSIVYAQFNVGLDILEVVEYDLSTSTVETLHTYGGSHSILLSPSGDAFYFSHSVYKFIDRPARRWHTKSLVQTLLGPVIDTGAIRAGGGSDELWLPGGTTVLSRHRAVHEERGIEFVDDDVPWWRLHLDGKEPEVVDFSIPDLRSPSFQPRGTGLIFDVSPWMNRLEIVSLKRPSRQIP